MTDAPASAGPLRFTVPPPTGRERRLEAVRAVQQSLRGHTSAVGWLPEDSGWPELDAARDELLRLRGEIIAAQEERTRLVARFAVEDKAHTQDLRRAQRDGVGQVEDRRTSSEGRQSQLAEVADRFWAAAVVMAEKANAVVALVREREDDWLGNLRGRLGPAQEKRREMQRLEAEATAEEWQLHKLGDWLQKTADDGPFGRQPAPTPEPPPKQFDAETARSMLERPWHKQRDAEELPVSWQEQSGAPDVTPPPAEAEPEPPEDPDGDSDPTGEVSELDPSVSGAS